MVLALPDLHALPPVVVAETMDEASGIVDLWSCEYGHDNHDVLLAHDPLLSAEERQRYGRYRFERDRAVFLATRALVRNVLSQYVPVLPKDWRFESNAYGKPHISAPPAYSHLHFNLSNIHGMVVCAVSRSYASIGVDVESITGQVDEFEIAESHFSHSEAAALRAAPADQRSQRFVSYWTLKESFIKANGKGLSMPLDRFSFETEKQPITISFADMSEDPALWRFHLIDAGQKRLVALAAKTGGQDMRLRGGQIAL